MKVVELSVLALILLVHTSCPGAASKVNIEHLDLLNYACAR